MTRHEAHDLALERLEQRNKERAIQKAKHNDGLSEWADDVAERELGELFDDNPDMFFEDVVPDHAEELSVQILRNNATTVGDMLIELWMQERRDYIDRNRSLFSDEEWVRREIDA